MHLLFQLISWKRLFLQLCTSSTYNNLLLFKASLLERCCLDLLLTMTTLIFFFIRHTMLIAQLVECVFLGYCLKHKSYHCYNPFERCIPISWDITFDENKPFFYSATSQTSSLTNSISFLYLPYIPSSEVFESTVHTTFTFNIICTTYTVTNTTYYTFTIICTTSAITNPSFINTYFPSFYNNNRKLSFSL